MTQEIRIEKKASEQFIFDVFILLGLPQEEVAILVAANTRGITSHGVGRL
jgi:LDH2 family malate/lactate/ureidoglycolate dehydrogenase